MEKKKFEKLFIALALIGVYLLSTGLSYAVFNYLGQTPAKTSPMISPTTEGALVDTSGPKTEVCPINGQLFTKAEKEVWSQRRPLTVMIENHQEARPQSGLSEADVVYEAVAEGGITRFMAVLYCDAVAKDTILGPIRSARTYFLDWASEYGGSPLYVHVGGAHCDPQTGEGCLNGAKADALGQIAEYGWEGENDLNQFSVGYPTFWRDYERIGHTVATEHTMYSTTEKLWQVAKERGWTNRSPEGEDWQDNFTAWAFKDEADKGEAGAETVEYIFWDGHENYRVRWEYDDQEGVYKRFNGGQPHLDLNTNEQLAVKNLVVLLTRESPANDGYPGNIHLLYQTIGRGEALIFQAGQVIEAEWSKDSRKARTKFVDEDGQELEFVRGPIWISVVPLDTAVDY